MAPGFSFPPPPPPPPPKAVSDQHDYSRSRSFDVQPNYGGGRGRGQSYNRGHYRNHRGRGGPGGGDQYRSTRDDSVTYQLPAQLPPGTHVNPAFARSLISGSQDGQNNDHKRKRVEDQSWRRDTRRAPHPMRKPTTIPAETPAPTVPSFGGTVPVPQVTSLSASNDAKPSVVKPNKLGLNPSLDEDVEPSDESDEDVDDNIDEEAAFTGLKGGPLFIEHEGSIIKLQDSVDIKAWIKQRKAMFPSQKRIEAKDLERLQRIEERKRIEREAADASSKPEPAVSEVPSAQTHAADTQDKSKVDGSDEDSAPEQVSSKEVKKPLNIPANRAPVRNTCAVFRASGTCKFGTRCRYEHPSEFAVKAKPSGRMTLHQRLMEQETDKADAQAVQAIKYLGDRGFFRQLGNS